MKSTVEHLSPTRVRINVEVPFDELKPDFDRAYKKIAQQVRIPGFRPGKAPARILEARIGRAPVLDEVVNNAIPTKYQEAVVSAEDVTPIGRPDIEVTEIADGERIAFTAEVDVRPEIALPDLDGLAVEVDETEVDEEQVTEQLDQLRARFGTLAGVERPATSGDYVQIDLSAAVDGKEIEEATTTGFSYEIGQGGLIEGIDEALEGMSADEEKTFTSKLVAGEHADADAEITVKVTTVKERHLPDADDEFAQLASEFDTLDELTENLRERLGQSKRMEQAAQARDRLLDKLVEGTEVPLPESVVQAEVDNRLHDAVHAFDHDEERFAEFLSSQDKTREQFDAESREEAEKAVRYRLVLDALADSEEVSVNDQEITERILYQAQQYGMAPEQFVQQIQQAGQIGAIYQDVRRSKALITAVRAASVTLPNGEAVDLSDLLGDDEATDEAAEGTVEGTVVEGSEDTTSEAADAADEASGEKADAKA
ncbi:trigger factor [Pseudonocardia sp. EC080610-09]|uniref:trigger factor n=1 Tax=unclassified Pseudonocardia TaxID=2619320 RepID=UPI0006CB7C39|nr:MULTISPECIES: trigger factor [unclassified Pseudonocardia]ALE72690.1 trigger factor [Pseudonocardia sp. EC080625-04]ALL76002.1 trigger factor [Pseudonocardia sp. EC080610-09]ALL83030.1 trigger factor [Pseudonocardia sp. EC080619-01]